MSATEELQLVTPSKLEVKDIVKTFTTRRNKITALDNVSLTVAEGEFVCLVGPSGCGKSTLLNLIAGLDTADSGTLQTDGQPITGTGRDRMVMFQEHALFPWLDVMGNVLFGLKLKPSLTDKDRVEVAKYYLHLVGLERFADSNIHELS
ncbi:MAG TPA: ATP-binding cassette domain-containing protein, partial [Verrucomicrobiales bacterium]|nr:ATP-binding cassette domain-containing protein [Verrucomicrobiales bacterium]